MTKRKTYAELERVSQDWTAQVDTQGRVWYTWNLPKESRYRQPEYTIRKVDQGPSNKVWQLEVAKNSFEVEYTYYDTPEDGQKAAFTKHFGLLYALAVLKDEDDDTHI